MFKPSEITLATSNSKNKWLVSFADLITLILAFFVMMFAAKVPEKKYYEELQLSFRNFFDGKSIDIKKDDNLVIKNLKPAPKNYSLTYFENRFKAMPYNLNITRDSNFISATILSYSPKFDNFIIEAANLISGTKNQVTLEFFSYEQKTSLNKSIKILENFTSVEPRKNILIKLNENILLPEKNAINSKRNIFTITILAREESI